MLGATDSSTAAGTPVLTSNSQSVTERSVSFVSLNQLPMQQQQMLSMDEMPGKQTTAVWPSQGGEVWFPGEDEYGIMNV